MSSMEETLAELIETLREMLAHLKLEETTILSGNAQLDSSHQVHHKDLKKKIRKLNLRVKKSIQEAVEDDVEKATLLEQKESLERKIKELTKANKKLINSFSLKPLLEDPPQPKQVLLDDENEAE